MNKKLTSKEKIIKFMEAKNKVIKNCSRIEYFNKNDESSINNWSIEDCDRIWKKIIYIYDDLLGLNSPSCPFCLKYGTTVGDLFMDLDCKECEYGQEHGICNIDENNIYSNIIRTQNYDDIFTENFYKDLIDKLENN